MMKKLYLAFLILNNFTYSSDKTFYNTQYSEPNYCNSNNITTNDSFFQPPSYAPPISYENLYTPSPQQQSFDPSSWIRVLRESRKKDWINILEDPTADINSKLVECLSCFDLDYLSKDFIKKEKKIYIEQQIEEIFKHTEKTGLHPNRSKLIINALFNISTTLNINLSSQIQVVHSWVDFQKSGLSASTYFGSIIPSIPQNEQRDFFEKYFIFLHERNDHSRSLSNKFVTSCGFRISKTEECAKALIGFCAAFRITYPREILTTNLDFLPEKSYKAIIETGLNPSKQQQNL